MKMLKRVFIAALCLAVLISCFAVLASAKEYTTDNFKDILEYYEEPIVLDDNFGAYEEGATYTENVYNNSTGAADMAVVSNGTDKYLKFHSGVTSAPKTKDMFINGNFATPVDDFVFKTTIAGSGDSKTSIKEIIVWIDATTEDVAAFDGEFGTEFININYGASTNEGVVYYYDAATATSVALEGVTINDTDKFEVLLTYNGTKGTYSLTVTSLADANNTATVKDVAAPFKTVSNLKIGSLSASNKANRYVCIYDLALYGGTFVRDNANKQAETEAAINAMYTIYTEENKADGTDVEIAIVAGKLDKYGFTTTDDAVAAKFSELLGIGINIFAEELEKFVAAFDATATYEARVAHVNKYADSAALMPEDLSPAGEEKAARIAELLDAFNTEKTTLDSIKTNSDAFIKALEGAMPPPPITVISVPSTMRLLSITPERTTDTPEFPRQRRLMRLSQM